MKPGWVAPHGTPATNEIGKAPPRQWPASASQSTVSSLEPLPSTGGAPEVANPGQGWDSSELGHVNPVSIYERNDVSVWKVRNKCGRIYTQPKPARETMNTTISTWMKFFFIWSWQSLLYPRPQFYIEAENGLFSRNIRINLIWGKGTNLALFFFFLRSNILQIFCLNSCNFQICLLRQLICLRAKCLH